MSNGSKPIGTAVIGTGLSATIFQIPFILSLPQYFRLITIVERKATAESSISRDRYGSQVPDLKVVNTLEEVLEDDEIELVVISTPNPTHYPYAKVCKQFPSRILNESLLRILSALKIGCTESRETCHHRKAPCRHKFSSN